MSNTPYRKIDYSKLRFSEKHISSEQALKDVEPSSGMNVLCLEVIKLSFPHPKSVRRSNCRV